jgi:hypothetical protein
MRCWNVALYRELIEEHFFGTKAEAEAFRRESKAEGFKTEIHEFGGYPATNAGLASALNQLIAQTCHNEG